MFIKHTILPDLFLGNKSFSDLWTNYCIVDEDNKFIFKIGQEVFKDALMEHLGGNQDPVLTSESYNMLVSLLPVEVEAITDYESIRLIDLVNLTDFIDLSKILTIFQQDKVEDFYDRMKDEKSIVSELYNQNYSFK